MNIGEFGVDRAEAFHPPAAGADRCVGLGRPVPGWVLSVVAGAFMAAPAAEWTQESGYRWRELEAVPAHPAGFTRLEFEATGIGFTNTLDELSGAANRVLYNGAGVAAGDVDGDGRPDLFLCNLDGHNALYRNLGRGRFEETTAQAGLGAVRPGTRGAVLVDINADRHLDLLLSVNGHGAACFMNNGRGVFRETTPEAGTSGRQGSTTLALADIDGNGTLDLYVTNYRPDDIRDRGRVSISMVGGRPIMAGGDTNRFIMLRGRLEECGQPDQLFLGDGAGHFRAVSWTAGAFLDEQGRALAGAPLDWGLTASFRDLNEDGAPDLYVCNDYWTPDRFWLNDGHGRFRAAAAMALRKTPASSMSADFADLDRDGNLDFFVVDMLSRFPALRKRQMPAQISVRRTPGIIDDRPQVLRNTLFMGRGDGTFAEVGFQAGLAATDWSWSAIFLDADLDGFDDLLVGAGHFRDVQDIDGERVVQARQRSWAGFATEGERQQAYTRELMEHFRLYPKLDLPLGGFRNRGNATFEEVTREWGLSYAAVHQGIALADFDGDGDLDVADNTLNSAFGIYRNETGAGRVTVRLKGMGGNTAGIGARVTLLGGAIPRQTTEVVAGGRYLSGSDTELVFATGRAKDGMGFEIQWRNGRVTRISGVLPHRGYEVEETGGTPAVEASSRPMERPLFEDVSERLKIRHQESEHDDFARQPLLPFRRGNAGPALAWGDLNGDGREDLLVGSSVGGMPRVGLNRAGGGFEVIEPKAGATGVAEEPAGLLVLPDGTNAPVIVAGLRGYRSGVPQALAELRIQGSSWTRGTPATGADGHASTLAMADALGRGKPLLFVAGGVRPGRYPLGAPSRLYAWEGGRWVVDARSGVQFENIGIVNGAVWTDLDADGIAELVLACEWGPVRVFQFRRGGWTEVTREWGLLESTGWWRGVSAGDFNGDGRMDLVAANWGWNSPHQASRPKPLTWAFGEIAQPGVMEIIEAEWDGDRLTPRRSFRTLSDSLPFLLESFSTVRGFAEASLEEVLGDRAPLTRRVAVNTLATTVFLNTGHGFRAVELPREAQATPVHGIAVADFDGDGNEDLFLAQNFSGTQPDDGPIDAGMGLVLLGNGAGEWRALSPAGAGVRIHGDQRAVALSDFDADGRIDLAVSQNAGDVKLLRNLGGRPGLRVRLRGPAENPWGIGASLRWSREAAFGAAREIHAGGGYWSQDGRVQVLARLPGGPAIQVRWPGGRTTTVPVPAGAKELEIDAGRSR